MNKLTKLLSLFVIAGAIGTGVAGVAGCKKPTPSHTEHNYKYTDNKDGTHDATCDGCDSVIDNEPHSWGTGNKCVCGAEKPNEVHATGVTVTGPDEVGVNESVQLTAVVTPEGCTDKVEWSVIKGTKRATVDENGKVTGVDRGDVTVQVKVGEFTATHDLKVKFVQLTGVSLPKAVVQLKPDEEYTLAPVFTPENASDKKITWTCDKPDIATVDETGKVKGVADGNATITGKIGDFTVTCKVEVDHTFVDAKYEVNVSDSFEATKADNDRRVSFVTVTAGTEVRTRTKELVYENKEDGEKVSDAAYLKSIKIGGTSDAVKLTIPAAGTLTIHAQNGSSGNTTWQQLLLSKEGGASQTIQISAHNGSPTREIKVEITEGGEYTILRSGGTVDIYYIGFEGKVKDTPLEKIEVTSAGKNEYFVGQQYSYSDVLLDKVYSVTGRTESLAVDAKGVSVDISEIDMSKSGVYPVTVTYNDGSKDFKASYNVTVYAVDTLEVAKDAIVKEASNTSAGNGVYANHHLRELYFAGEEFSTDGMTVIVNASIGEGADKKTQSFIIKSGYTITGNDLSTAGKKVVSVKLDGTDKSEEFIVYVISGIEDLKTATSVTVNVDAGIGDNEVGVIKNDAYQFKTIHQALEFLEHCGISDNATKIMTVAAGTYNEKLEINVPNLTMIGAGSDVDGTHTLIEWDSLFGLKDAGGFVHTTDSTATFNVREKAVGFTMRNMVVSNWFNCVEHFNERFGENYSEHRALAMLVQADKVVVENSTLLGYQDTLELFTGRHVFKNSLIVGVTDFIFGTNGTTYFTGCEIRAIKHNDDVNEKDGQIKGHVGYYTAFKGNNKGSTADKVTYGAIFDNCDFTAEEGVTNGWALGRAWGADAAVMVMNSRLGGHISKSSDRYVSMGNGVPENAQFTEYNNSALAAGDDGSVATPVKAGQKDLWKVPSEADAAKYADFATIFGKTNGLVTYGDVWNGESGAKITKVVYDLKSYSGADIQGATGSYAGVSIDTTNGGKLAANGGQSVHLNKGTVLTIPMDKRYKVSFTWHDGNLAYTDTNIKVEYLTEQEQVTACKITISKDNVYMCTIEVDMAVEMRIVTIKDKENDAVIGTTLVESGEAITPEEVSAVVTANAIYSSKLVDKIYADATNEYAGAAITADATLYVTTVDADIIYDKTESVDITACPDVAAGATVKYKGIVVEATTGNFTTNGSGWMHITQGVTLKIKVGEGATVTCTEHSSTAGNIEVGARDADGFVTLKLKTDASEGYISAINVKYSKTYAVGDNIDLRVSSIPQIDGVEITGDIQANTNSLKTNTGTVIKINAAEGTTVKINWYNHANANDNNIKSCEYQNGQIVIEIQSSDQGAPNGSIYIESIDIIAAS